jgi:hypothetical protein
VWVTSNSIKTPWPESASELYRPSDRSLSAKLVSTFEHRGSHVVSVMDPYGCIFGFLDRSRYFFFHVALQLYSRGSVDLVPDPLLLRKSGSAGNRIRTSGSAARNSDNYTTEEANSITCIKLEVPSSIPSLNRPAWRGSETCKCYIELN